MVYNEKPAKNTQKMRKMKNILNHKEIRKIHSFTAEKEQNQTQFNPKVLFKGTH